MMEKMDCTFLMWILFVIIYRVSATLPTWNMHSVCGRTISQTDKGGFLVFNSFLLPAAYKMDCSVVIQPAPTESSTTSGHYVLFHFSNFKVGESCQHTNVTVTDGNGINMKPIDGLKSPMCGTNSSLTKDVTFRTQSFYITVLFQSDATGLNFLSKFNMTFLSFSEGSCGSGHKDLFSCTNNRCVDSEFTCLNLNPCGDNSDCSRLNLNPCGNNSDCSSKKPVTEAAEKLVQYIVIGIFSIFGLCIFCAFSIAFRRHRRFNDEFFSDDFFSSGRSRSCDCCSNTCECCGDILVACLRCECCRDRYTACRQSECCEYQFTFCRRCDCCRSLAGGVLDACRRLKSSLTSAQQAENPHGDSDMEDPDTLTQSTRVSEERRERNRPRSRLSSASSSEHSRRSSFASVDSETFHASDEGGATGGHTDAPPSYQEAASSKSPVRSKHQAPSAPSIPSAPPASPETAAPPSYEEVVANVTKYVNKK